MKIAGYIVVTVKFHKDDKRWTAYCEELGTATFGRSLPEAQERPKEAVLLHLNTLEDVGERERFFRENNIHFHSRKPKKTEQVTIKVPLDRSAFIQSYIQPLEKRVSA